MASEMDQPLFSEAPLRAESDPTNPPPARLETVTIPVDQTTAFEGFTEYLHLWWPVSVTAFGEDTQPYFSETEVAEESADGATHVWANIDEFDPPERIHLAWILGANPESPTEVTVDFQESADNASHTVLSLIHRGWAPGSEGWDQYRKYSHWPEILTSYAHFMGAKPADAPVE